MMSTNFVEFMTPSPLSHLDVIYAVKFMQPLLLCPLFPHPLPLSDADIISGSSPTGWSNEDELRVTWA